MKIPASLSPGRFAAVALAFAAVTTPSLAQAAPAAPADAAAKSEARRAWFEEARFGLFIHWGLYSALEGSWDGRSMPDGTKPNGNSWYAEWILPRMEVPEDKYRAIAKRFDPVNFNADAFVAAAKVSGIKYVALTSKHHDGFALWDSAVSDYDMGATPSKRDLLGELAAACKKHGIKLGFYYSHWQDWDHTGGAKPNFGKPWKPQPTDAEFEKYWKGKALPQVAELIKRYDPDLLWFDTWGGEERKQITSKRRDELIGLIRSLSPKCLINGRICSHAPGNDIDFLEMDDNAYPKEWPGRPWQTPATMQHSWGYHATDYNWLDAGQMIRNLARCASLGGNYLLNVGPKFDGSLPAPAQRRFLEMGGWMAANGDSIRGTARLGTAPWGCWTRAKDDSVRYAHVFNWPSNRSLPLGKLDGKTPKSAALLEFNRPLELSEKDGEWFVALPNHAPDRYDSVIKVSF